MELVRLICGDFRCLEAVDFRAEPGMNVIRGDNAQGKTSLLEALFYVVTSRSHRTSTEAELARHGCAGFRIEAQVHRVDRDVALEVTWWKGAKRVKVNGVAQNRVSDILGKAHVVLFSPEDTILVRGSASHRRKFLDMTLSQLSPAYLTALQQYRRSLRQRNETLRSDGCPVDPQLVEAWSVPLAEHGATLMKYRNDFVKQLGAHAERSYGELTRGESLEAAYSPDIQPDDVFLDVLKQTFVSDVKRGVTTRGPHRDDFELTIAGSPARNYASQGQQKSAALSLRWAELAVIAEEIGDYPILLLDDVLSELDESRSQRLFNALDDDVQCLLTTTKPSGPGLTDNKTIAEYLISGGRIEAK